jgi:guanine deaminase
LTDDVDLRCMERAIELSLENVRSGRGGPFAAVVARGGEIIAEAANCVTATKDPTAHAEIVAIREACRKIGHFELTGCDLYTTCEPCPMCLGAIYWARPARVFYANTEADAAAIGFDDAFIYAELKRPLGDRKVLMIQILREKALEAFRAWQAKTDKATY